MNLDFSTSCRGDRWNNNSVENYLGKNTPHASPHSITQFREAMFAPGKKALSKLQFINNTSPANNVLKD